MRVRVRVFGRRLLGVYVWAGGGGANGGILAGQQCHWVCKEVEL